MKRYRPLYIEHSVIGALLVIASGIILNIQSDFPWGKAIWYKFGLFTFAFFITLAFSLFYTIQLLENENKKLHKAEKSNEKLKNNSQVQDRIIALTHELMDVQNTKNALNKILEYAIDSIDHAVAGTIMLINENDKLSYAASKGYKHEALLGICLDIKETFLWQKTNGNIIGPVIINNAKAFSKSIVNPDIFEALIKSDALYFESTLSSPLFLDGKLYGMINVDSTNKDAFGEEALRLIKYFTYQAEFAIKNLERLERVYKLSRFDSLTNVFNRRHFQDLLEMDITKAARYDISFLLVLFDLNGLKHINDTYGHPAGDKCIIYFANGLKNLMRKQDLLARYGGDEFIAYFYMCDWKDLTLRIEEFRKHFRDNPCIYDNIEIPISFSYGIAEFPSDGATYAELFHKADSLMYTAKREFKQLNFLSKDIGLQESK